MTTSSTDRTRHVERKRRTGPFVRYVGGAEKRTITATDWRSFGVTDAKVVHEWTAANEYLVESLAFNDAQLDDLLIDDTGPNDAHGFIEVDFDADGNLVQVGG